MKKRFQWKNSEQGSALVFVLVIVIGMGLLIPAYSSFSLASLRAANQQLRSTQAYYIARAGAEATAKYIENNPVSVADTGIIPETAGDREFGPLVNFGDGAFRIKVIRHDAGSNANIILIYSEGIVSKVSNTVIIALEEEQNGENGNGENGNGENGNGENGNGENGNGENGNGNGLDPFSFPYAIFSHGDFRLEGSSSIIGTVGTNTTVNNSVFLGHSPQINISEDLYIGPDASFEDVIDNYNNRKDRVLGEIHNMGSIINYPDPIFPEFPDTLEQKEDFKTYWVPEEYYPITEDGYYDLIEATDNRTITVDLAGGDRILQVKNFNISQGHINLINNNDNGRLIIYVEEKLTVKGDSTINSQGDTDMENVIIYYKGVDQPSIGGNTRIVSSLFLESADIEIRGSNGITGHIISGGGKVEVTGNARVNNGLIYAPSSEVIFGGSGEATGSVIAGEFKAIGSAKVYFDNSNIDSSFIAELIGIESWNGSGNGNSGNGNGNGENGNGENGNGGSGNGEPRYIPLKWMDGR